MSVPARVAQLLRGAKNRPKLEQFLSGAKKPQQLISPEWWDAVEEVRKYPKGSIKKELQKIQLAQGLGSAATTGAVGYGGYRAVKALKDSNKMGKEKQASKNVRMQVAGLAAKALKSKQPTKAMQYAGARNTARSIGKGPIGTSPWDRISKQTTGGWHKGQAQRALGKTAMDQELALSVVNRYQSGLPVDEMMLFKAAHAVGADPYDSLLEARFETMLRYDLQKAASGHRIDPGSLAIYSAAVGEDPRALVKTAARFHLDPQELVLRKLAEQDWVPNLELIKIAMMADAGGAGMQQMQSPMQDPSAGGMGMQPGAGAPPQDPNAGPMPGAAVQKARYKPSPMAPMQTPPSAEGNLNELVDAARHPDMAADQAAAEGAPGGSMAPQAEGGSMMPGAAPGMEQEAAPPPQMTPDQKLMQVDPSIDPQSMERWAPKLQEIEEQTGIQMQDPAQIQKFIGEMQKADQKALDEAIKEMNTPQPLNKPTNPNSPAAGAGGAPASAGVEKVATYGLSHADMMTAARRKEPRWKNYIGGGAAIGGAAGGATALGALMDAAKSSSGKGRLGIIAKAVGLGAGLGAAGGAALKPLMDEHQREATEYADDYRPGWSQGGARGEQLAKDKKKTAGLRLAYLP